MRQLLNLLLFTAILAVSFLSLDGQIPTPGDSRQAAINEWITERKEMYRSPFEWVEFLRDQGVRGLATGFYGVAVPSELQEIILPETKDEPKMWKSLLDKFSSSFYTLVGISKQENLKFYIVTSSDGYSLRNIKKIADFDPYLSKLNLDRNMIKGKKFSTIKNNCLSGKKLVSELLWRYWRYDDVDVAEIVAYDPRRYQNPGTYKRVNPEAKKNDKMPMDKTFHLEQVKNDSGLSPSEILFIDDNLEFCKAACRQGYLVLHVNVPEDAPKDKPALQWSRLEAVPLTESRVTESTLTETILTDTDVFES